MAEEKKPEEKAEIVYTPEELQTIRELTSFFNKAPGQVTLDDGAEPAPAGSEEPPESIETETGSAEAPQRPLADLSKFDDVLNMDIDNFGTTPAAEAQDVPLDVPLAESDAAEPSIAEAPGEFPLDMPVESAPASTQTADLDFGDSLDLSPATAEAPADTPGDFTLPDETTAQETTPAADFDFGAPETAAASELDVGAPTDLDAGTAQQEIAADFDLGAIPETSAADSALDLDSGIAPAEPAADSTLDLDLPNTEATATDMAGDLPIDSGDLGAAPDLGDIGSDFNFDTPAPQQDLPAAPTDDMGLGAETATPDLGDFTTAPASQDDAFNFDAAAPSLDDLSPEVALGDSGSSLSSDLSSLAEEQSASVDPATLRRVRETLRAFPAALRRRLSQALLDENMKPADSAELMRLLAEGATANEISAWLDARNIAEIPEEEAAEKEPPRIIMARPEYTDEALARQERIIKLTRWGAIAAFVAISLVGGLYFSILKPMFYRQAVAKGRDMILKSGSAAISDAEKQFEKALGYYSNDTYAYLQYAEAYRYKGLYAEAFAKLFAELKLPPNLPAVKAGEREVRSSAELFGALKRVPVVAYAGDGWLSVNGTQLALGKKGAYVISHLDNKRDEAQVLLALGSFHGNPSRRFAREPYKNNYLAADYYRRVLMANPATPAFKREEMLDRAVMGLGDLFYHEKDYDRALDYYKKIIDKEPLSVAGHAGIFKALLKLHQLNGDPRMVIQHHTSVRNKKLEHKLPMYLKARLAAFYIDLPAANELRVRYNIPPGNLLTGEQLKTRADDLLNSIFNSTETDIFGQKIEGTRFAEGYYQRARSFAKDKNQIRMALKQFEYAFHYDPRHFMALNDRAELLMAMNDFSGAMELLRLAKNLSTPDKLAELGENEQDETLAEAPVGLISFNMGKAMYLDAIRDLSDSATWFRLKEVQKYRSQTDQGMAALLARLDRIEVEFNEARERGIAGTKAESELLYFSGWTKYVRNDHRGALADWEKIDVDKAASLPNLSLAQSHCYYRLAIEEPSPAKREKYLDSALGLLFYSHDRFSAKINSISHIDVGNDKHARLVSNLAIIENNIGAIYELLDDEQKSLMHYWKSIENSKRIGKENEIANLNIRLSFKRKGLGENEQYPVIMDYVPALFTDEL